jgi:phage FluMu gp28-like protein
VLEETRNQGISHVEGVKFTVQTKEELLTSLKIAMEQNRFAMPIAERTRKGFQSVRVFYYGLDNFLMLYCYSHICFKVR